MENIRCNNSSLVCINHFRQSDYKIQGDRRLLNVQAVPSQFAPEIENDSEIPDNDDQKLENNERKNAVTSEQVNEQKNELKRLEAEKNFWKEECIVSKAHLVKLQEEYDKLSMNLSVCAILYSTVHREFI